MTSELKPYAYAYIGKDGQLDGISFGTHPLTEGDLKAGYSQIPLYTRAVPDVPELVRYAPVTLFDGTASAAKTWNGEYVRYDQAAAIIAAVQEELALAVSDEDKGAWRFWSKKSRELADKNKELRERAEAAEAKMEELETAWLNAEGKISELEAKLAQIKRIKTIG